MARIDGGQEAMTDTFGDLVNSIANASRRFSMSSEIINCIYSAIEEYEPRRFWFNETTDTTFSLSSSQAVYTSADNSMIPRFMEIDRFEVTISSNDKQGLTKRAYTWIAEYNETNSNSQPYYFAYYGQSLHVNLPDGGYQATVSGLVQLASLSASTDSNAWTQRGNGKELIKQNALARLYSEYLRDDANATRAQAREMRALTRLESRTTSLQASGEIAPCL
jgi:hypothetical protein